jgi:PPK2 family polyphosphate:nucleotide phosphotransferase
MSGVNPQGTQVHSFKAPSDEELDHDFLWRAARELPERGNIGIFNRSYYEEVLVVRVHPELLERQKLPAKVSGKNIWKHRFDAINDFEKYLVRNGISVLKFYLHVSKEEQRRRLLARINTPDKQWKFSFRDPKERLYWDDYMECYEDMFNHTSTEHAPWYIIPADHKWFTRAAVADVIAETLKSMDLKYPVLSKAERKQLLEGKKLLSEEPS